jgi:spermidine dehydrogenase
MTERRIHQQEFTQMATDKELGLDRPISRRQFCQGSAVAVGASLVPWAHASGFSGSPELTSSSYPPALTGLRGAHAGSYETAHALAREGKRWGTGTDTGEGDFDLLVVGGGVSGLSAAWFYRQKHPAARILVIDNHDDFGGHAKRNEFALDGQTIIAYGGSQSIDTPSAYSPQALGLLEGLGIDTKVFYKAFDQEFYSSRGMKGAFWLDKETFSVDRLVKGNPLYYGGYENSSEDINRFAREITTNAEDQETFLRILNGREDYLPDKSPAEKVVYLRTLSYDDYLRRYPGASQYLINLINPLTKGYWGIGTDGLSAREAMSMGLPGFAGLGVDLERDDPYYKPGRDEPYIFHCPDGNAGITRLLVRQLVPGIAPGSTMQDQVTAPFDYSLLDRPENLVKIRLNATVVNVQHQGNLSTARKVAVRYVKDGVAHEVQAKNVVYAAYSAMLPSVCPEFPQEQADQFAKLVKIPLLYTNVLLRNWRAFDELGINRIRYPGGLFGSAVLDFPVSMGGYEFSKSPDDPIVVHMTYVPSDPGKGLDARTQNRLGRHTMMQLGFEDYERAIRKQLGDSLAAGGFDPARDIAAVTVNRWPHGYAYEYNDLYDPPEWDRYQGPHLAARKPFGRVSIANSDSEAFAYIDGAIDAAYRAVN